MQHSERVHVVCACVWMHHVCVCMCVCVLGVARSWMFASTALVVEWTAMYMTDYSDYLTGFCEPLLPPYWYVTLVGKMSKAITDSDMCVIFVWPRNLADFWLYIYWKLVPDNEYQLKYVSLDKEFLFIDTSVDSKYIVSENCCVYEYATCQ